MRLSRFTIRQGQTNLLVKADADDLVRPVGKAVSSARAELISYIDQLPQFKWSLEPMEIPAGTLPPFIREMYRSGTVAGVGPFASVAGAMADLAARAAVAAGATNVLVENGGDLALYGQGPFVVGLHAGASPLSQRIGLRISPGSSYAGLCTSSASVGESISFGEADAVAAYSPVSAVVADAAATAICNEVKGHDGIAKGIDKAKLVGEVGVLIVRGERLAAWGSLPELVRLESAETDLVLNPDVHSRAR
jgi:ApbE superfamily uncharacterized protein (UPF0280 family)